MKKPMKAAGPLIFAAAIAAAVLISVSGIRCYAVLTGSMEPVLPVGSLLVAVPPCPSLTTTLTVCLPRLRESTSTEMVFTEFRVGANDFVVCPSSDSVAVKTSPESASSTV